MNRFSFLKIAWILFVLLLAEACAPKHPSVVLPPDFKGPRALQKLYGVKITPNDNIYLYNEGSRWLGTPYRGGGLTKRGVDCSGFVMQVYREVYHKGLQRSSDEQLRRNCKRISKAQLREGDLVFFATNRKSRKRANHVGIYLKNGRFIHASTSRGVVVSSLNEPYYLRTWLCGGRVK